MKNLLNGKKLSEDIYARISDALSQTDITPRLDIILANNDDASLKYVALKKKAGERLGIKVFIHQFGKDSSENEIITLIEQLNKNNDSHGIMIQLPTFSQFNSYKLISAISPEKDVDGLNPTTLGRLFHGDKTAFISATALGIVKMIDAYNINVTGKLIVMVGWNSFIGMPLEAVLTKRGASFVVTHSKTADLKALTSKADILITAVGKPKFIKSDFVKDGAIVLDAGFERGMDGKFYGDVDFETVSPKCSLITPVPGGVGPMTVVSLLHNVCLSAGII